jgi:response regulator RpfG family c-di-GMP phosphodiesterase
MSKENYSKTQTAELVEAYESADSEAARQSVVNEYADEFAKSTRSVIMKLVKEGVYVKKTYKSKTGEKPERKSAIVEDIAGALGVTSEQLPQLEKATVSALKLIRGTLVRLIATAAE